MPVTHMKALALALVVIAALHFEGAYSVRTIPDDATSMEPAVRRHTARMFRTDAASVPRGAVVWFEHPRHPTRMLLARAIGLPGDRVALRAGRAIVDGTAIAEDYVDSPVALEDTEEIIVPEGKLFLLVDARGEPGSPAVDSRRLGPVPLGLVAGWFRDHVAEREAEDARSGTHGRKGREGRR